MLKSIVPKGTKTNSAFITNLGSDFYVFSKASGLA